MKLPRLLVTTALLLALPAQAVRTNELVGSFKIAADLARRASQELAVTQAAAIITTVIASTPDADGDAFPEPPVYLTGAGPAGGGLIPTDLGAPTGDGYGAKLGYCAWDNGSVMSGGNRLNGSATDPGAITFAVVSAGLDGVFNRSCAQIASGATTTDDDFVKSVSAAQIRQGIGSFYFGDPVADMAALGLLNSASQKIGEMRLVKSDNTLWRWDGSIWQPVANTYAASNVAVTGGTINNTAIGNTIPSTGAFTTLSGTLTGNVTGNLAGNVSGNVTGNLTGNVVGNLTGNVTGNADTVSRLFTPRTLAISGDATWSVVFDGSANASGILTLANSGVAAGAYGSTTSVPSFIVDAKGRLTAAANVIITPALSSLTGAVADNTIGNSAYAQNWNWSLTGNTSALSIGETAASTGGSGNQTLLRVGTLAGSTAVPLRVTTRGVEAFRVDSINAQLVANNGTNSAPSYAFAGEQSTGLYLPAAGQLAASIAGTRSLWLTAGSAGFGSTALLVDTSGSASALGTNALAANTSGIENSALGYDALKRNTTGSSNTAVGYTSLKNNLVGIGNTAVGQRALYTNKGNYNTSVGFGSMFLNQTGADNVAIGNLALYDVLVGSNNIAIGSRSLYYSLADNNIAAGDSSMFNNTSGTNNVALGVSTLYSNTTGSGNVALGQSAGYKDVSNGTANANIDGNYNTYLGYRAMKGTVATINYATALGAAALVSSSNTLVLGRTSDVTVIGATADDSSGNKLQVSGGIKILSGALRLATGTAAVAPLTFGSGTNLSTLVPGALEFDGTNLFMTVTGPTRKTIAYLDSAMTGDGASITNLNANNIATGLLSVARGGTGINGSTAGNGQLLIGNGSGYTLAGLTGTANQIIVSAGSGSIGLSLPQSIDIVSSPIFAGLSLTGVLRATSGTVAAPGYTFAADTATGLYLPTTSQLAASVAGVRSMLVTTGSLSLGYDALTANSAPANNNVALGSNALQSNTTGTNNVATGFNALKKNTTASFNVATGNSALETNTTGAKNSAFGNAALKNNSTGYNNVAVGTDALTANTTGFYNTAVGINAMTTNTTSVWNVALGAESLKFNTIGNYNLATGGGALELNTTGSDNTAVGNSALSNNTIGRENVAVGSNALTSNTTGNFNVAIGRKAGYATAGGSTTNANVIGTNNTFIGAFAMPGVATLLDHATVLGADALVKTSNTVVLGRTTDKTVIGATGDDGDGYALQVTGGLSSVLAGSGTALFLGNKSSGNGFYVDISANTDSTQNYLNGARGTIRFIDSDYSEHIAFRNKIRGAANNADAERMRITVDGDVAIGQTTAQGANKLTVAGSVYATTFNMPSDLRYKINITPVINAVKTITALQGVHYEYNRAAFPMKNFEQGRNLGFIAQQIEPYVPEIVQTDRDGYKTVQYSQMVPLLAEGIKEQQLVLQHLIKKDPATLLVDIKTFQGNDAVFDNIKSTNLKAANLEADTARIKQLEADRIDTKYLRSDVMKTGETEVFVSLGSFQPIFIPLADAQYIVNATAEDGSSAFASVAFMGGKISVTPISGKGVDVTVMGSQVGLVAASKKIKATWIRMS